ncbi:hypothetical protein OC842_007287, partial [Tilletia horrida]
CYGAAEDYCGSDKRLHQSHNWLLAYYHCLAPLWASIPNDNNCPYPNMCRCYKGCVSDRSGDVTDVGSYCANGCRMNTATLPYSCDS